MEPDNKDFFDKLFTDPLYANYMDDINQKNIYDYDIIGNTNIKTEYLKRINTINPITKVSLLFGEIDLKIGTYNSLLSQTHLGTTGESFKEFYTKNFKGFWLGEQGLLVLDTIIFSKIFNAPYMSEEKYRALLKDNGFKKIGL